MDDAIIISTLIGSIFSVVGLLILDRNWFRRERFKFDQDTQKKEMALHFKKLAKELGVDSKTPPYRNPQSSPLDNISPLLTLAKNLNPDQLGAIADILGGQEAEGGEGIGGLPEGLSGLVDFAVKNPDLVKGFLSKAGDKLTSGVDESKYL